MEIRAFGPLRKLLEESPFHIEIPKQGVTGRELAEMLGMPLDEIECIMVDGRAQDLDYKITFCQRLAFVPYGTPGPYRLILGIKRQGR